MNPRSPELGPLHGVRIVELAGIGPAQHGTMLLSDLGAEVVRVDRTAEVPHPPVEGPSADVMGRGRRSIALDLKDPDGLAVARQLIQQADVLIDPYRPGVTERLNLGPDELRNGHPALVYVRMTGWGQHGPLATAAGHDINYIAIAGALETIGPSDAVPPVPLNLIADFGGGGMLMAFGVAAALLERERSGQGQVLDVAMVDGVASLMSGVFHLQARGEWVPGRQENWLQGAAPWYRAYRTQDGSFLTVGTLEEKFYVLLLNSLGLDPTEWPQWDRGRWPALAAQLERIFAEQPLSHWQDLLEGTDCCFAPAVTLSEVASHPHLKARETYIVRDGHLQPAPVPRFSRTPGEIRRPPPWPGQHTEEILRELQLDPGPGAAT